MLKLNIFLRVEPIIPDNFLNFSQNLFDMHSIIHLQFKIGDLIEEILDNWCCEKYRITIESFRRMSVIFVGVLGKFLTHLTGCSGHCKYLAFSMWCCLLFCL